MVYITNGRERGRGRRRGRERQFDNLLLAAGPEDRVDIEQQLTECQGNIQQLQGELH